MKTPQNLRIEAHTEHRAVVDWDDGNRRYHIWANHDGSLQSACHSNPLDATKRGHREVDMYSKANAKAIAIVRAFATREKIKAAMVERGERDKVERAAELKAARIHRLRDAMQAIIGANGDDLAEALLTAAPEIAAAATRLHNAGQ